jgi:hypothetical protein
VASQPRACGLMNISKFSRRFHDPWGNKRGTRSGTIIRFQYMVTKSELQDHEYYGDTGEPINSHIYFFDQVGSYERNKSIYVRTGKNGSEKIRR